jgi:hypothetical protein
VRSTRRRRGPTTARTILWSSDRTGTPQVWIGAAEAPSADAPAAGDAGALRVTDAPAGARAPAVRPSAGGGRLLAGVLLRGDGFRVALRDDGAVAGPFADSAAYPQDARVADVSSDSSPARAYSPWRTLLPRYWSPLAAEADGGGALYGAGTSGSDVLARHAYAAQAYVNAVTRDLEASAAWRYARIGQPLVDAAAVQTWQYDTVSVPLRDGTRQNARLDRREQSVTAALTFQRPRARTNGALAVGASYERRRYLSPLAGLADFQGDATGTGFPSLFVSGGWSNARRPLRSISPEDGVAVSASAEQRWGAPDGASRQVVGVGRLYKSLALPGFAHHVLAVRAAGGVADARASSEFSAGGTSGNSAALAPGFVVGTGGRTFGARGFPAGIQRGLRAAAGSVEYRAPVAMPARGCACCRCSSTA